MNKSKSGAGANNSPAPAAAAAAAASGNQTTKFAEGEKVLCFHGPLIYEAKCLKSQLTKENTVKYFIHYAGWNKNWDEWVPESRVLKYSEANVKKQKEVQKAHSSQPTKAKKGTKRKSEVGTSTPTAKQAVEVPEKPKEKEKEKEKDKDVESRASTPHAESASQDSGSDQPSRKKRGRIDQPIETEDQFINKIEVRIKVPEELRTWLVDDNDIITRQQKLASLPAKLTVAQILDDYFAHKKASKAHNPQKEKIILDIVTGISEFFDVALGSQLLYKFERPQYAELLREHSGTPMSKLYGAIHFLRLFVRIGAMMAYTNLDEKSMQQVVLHLHDILKYLSANKANLFSLQDYVNASPEYHRRLQ